METPVQNGSAADPKQKIRDLFRIHGNAAAAGARGLGGRGDKSLIHSLPHKSQDRLIVGTAFFGNIIVPDGKLGDIKLFGKLRPVVKYVLIQAQHNVADGLDRVLFMV